jgi:hypothetical protein
MCSILQVRLQSQFSTLTTGDLRDRFLNLGNNRRVKFR